MIHRYFLGGCVHGVNKLAGKSDVAPALPLPPTVQSLSSLFSLQTHRDTPPSPGDSQCQTQQQHLHEHSQCPSASLSTLPNSLPIFWSLLLCPSVSLLSKCYNPPRWHCSSPHLHPRTLPSDLTHATASSTLPNSDLQPQLFKGPRLAFPPLCMASSKRKGKSQVRHCRKVDKGRTEIRSLTTRSRSQMMYRRAFLWRGHIRRLCIV